MRDFNRVLQIVRATRWKVMAGLLPLLAVTFLGGVIAGGNLNWRISFHNPTLASNRSLPDDLDYSSVEKVYDALKREYDGKLDDAKLLDGIKQGLASSAGDPYTEYYDETGATELQQQLNGSFEGIGAELGKENNQLIVVSPIEGFPAQKAGLRPKDIIVEINGEPTGNIAVDAAVKKIRGKKGTTVKLTIVREGDSRELSITRDTITIPSVKWEIVSGNIGYLRVSRFSDDTLTIAEQAAEEFTDKKVNGIVLDLRSDPGGYLTTAVDLAGLWLKDKIVVEEKRDGVVVQSYRSGNNTLLGGIKTIVLIDEGSASASEIVAGALHDYGVAQLVGVKSFGKGSVQTIEPLGDGAVLKVTVARWFTPNGKNIDKSGIKPDIEIKLSDDDIKAGRDVQKDKAFELLK